MQSAEASCSLGRSTTHLVSASLPRSRDLSHCGDFLWCIARVPVLLLSHRRRTVGRCDVLERSFFFTLGREGSAFLCWQRIMRYRICPSSCLARGLLLSFTSITTSASRLWLMLLLSSTQPLWITHRQNMNSWLFIMLYLLYVLL